MQGLNPEELIVIIKPVMDNLSKSISLELLELHAKFFNELWAKGYSITLRIVNWE